MSRERQHCPTCKQAMRFSRPAHGEETRRHILTERDVREIRLRASLGVKQVTLAKSFGVSKGTIHYIVHYKLWAHVP